MTSKWFGCPGMTSRLNSNGMIENAWMTSVETRLNLTVSFSGMTSTGSWLLPVCGLHGSPFMVTSPVGEPATL